MKNLWENLKMYEKNENLEVLTFEKIETSLKFWNKSLGAAGGLISSKRDKPIPVFLYIIVRYLMLIDLWHWTLKFWWYCGDTTCHVSVFVVIDDRSDKLPGLTRTSLKYYCRSTSAHLLTTRFQQCVYTSLRILSTSSYTHLSEIELFFFLQKRLPVLIIFRWRCFVWFPTWCDCLTLGVIGIHIWTHWRLRNPRPHNLPSPYTLLMPDGTTSLESTIHLQFRWFG